MMRFVRLVFLLFLIPLWGVELGIDCFFEDPIFQRIKKKRVGLITNQTGLDSSLRPTKERIGQALDLVALFSPEHGIDGSSYAGENVASKKKTIPIYSLHGQTRRPTKEMLKGIDVLIFDIQDIGMRGYTYISTLFYAMEEAAKEKIEMVVLDRPNPMSGVLIDGEGLEKEKRSFVGYVDIPYCHGMTIGELAAYFNDEYSVGCSLSVVKMKGWNRSMSFKETQLNWMPTSPHIPESDTPLYAATTGILGELSLVNIGIGYTLPFKLVGAPWIKRDVLARHLNNQKIPGATFIPYTFRPFYGLYSGEDCEGVMIKVTDPQVYKPQMTQYLIIGLLKGLYPKEVSKRLAQVPQSKREMFCKVMGSDKILNAIEKEKVFAWKFVQKSDQNAKSFAKKRQPYLFKEYSGT